ncbi:MAG: hypothetical protein AVDCRST_MAG66-4665 [uncultured Pseudonocardia sp.]|uniref:Uncharacterized protein n=1 Tax=uncultured Pseudonocardia sp. TaxID=211455 RepID=A0A6J4QT09_9PSEU|nr:MAG: hypothetical protein AVDCRST_MAG66-4665 [uncultured Pseudonocardia sp.]
MSHLVARFLIATAVPSLRLVARRRARGGRGPLAGSMRVAAQHQRADAGTGASRAGRTLGPCAG